MDKKKYYFLGKEALTPSKYNRLIKKLQTISTHIHLKCAQTIFLVETTAALNDESCKILAQLLEARLEKEVFPACGFVITPRLGTISPWSTQATQVVKLCGLDTVVRIEHAIGYTFDQAENQEFIHDIFDKIAHALFDRMTQSILWEAQDLEKVFFSLPARPSHRIPLLEEGISSLKEANKILGLALSDDEMQYLLSTFQQMKRNPTDAELMMFAQANSEHCRHKIFNAKWEMDGQERAETLFGMIRHTSKVSPEGLLVAYNDNAAVIEGGEVERFWPDAHSHVYRYEALKTGIVMKVETHNHPTAISPFPGAATGAGGEIRDEGATGRGAKPKAGLVGYAVADLCLPDFTQPWELDCGKPASFCSSYEIMLDAPIGAARFNNEFGRPNLCGFFRTLSQPDSTKRSKDYIGYLKPIMIAGGMGVISQEHIKKQPLPAEACLIVLGGPAMLIGLGGGAASSMDAGMQSLDLDFASVQRGNPEMQRRAQEVIDTCWGLGKENPILSIHDVGAGGLSNAFPELVENANCGAYFDLQKIPTVDSSLSPLELWSNEAQERYVLAIDKKNLDQFHAICDRERCPYAVVGYAIPDPKIILMDTRNDKAVIDLPTEVIVGNPLRMQRIGVSSSEDSRGWDTKNIVISEAIKRVLQHPAVADKSFLITIGDRSVGGLVARDQMVGPWQVPVADVAVTASGFKTYQGEAMAMGERSPIAITNAPASARMAVGEAITNIMAASIKKLEDIKLSANWMASTGSAQEDGALFSAVEAVGMELCPALGIAIPVGKDSLSMRARWEDKQMRAPLSLIISAFSPVTDVRETLIPLLQGELEETRLVLIDLGESRNRVGGSILAQVFGERGGQVPDVSSANRLKQLFDAIGTLRKKGLLLAYHDRSDGGLFATVSEMCFASRCGVSLIVPEFQELLPFLFNEELGVVIQIRKNDLESVMQCLKKYELDTCTTLLGTPMVNPEITIQQGDKLHYSESRATLQSWWSETSYRMQSLRDNPECAKQQYDLIKNEQYQGLTPNQIFLEKTMHTVSPQILKTRPRIAILREQGVNGHSEMAAAFEQAGFECIDVTMQDLIKKHRSLHEFKGLAACGGFSYSDVLGAGRAWAMNALFHSHLAQEFQAFFEREDTFTLGVCNGCQMLSQLRDLIPGTQHWPEFIENQSEQFEARLSLVKIPESKSILLAGMKDWIIPVVVSHGEGRAHFVSDSDLIQLREKQGVALQYVDSQHRVTMDYPLNPNGSPEGITGITNQSGRVTLLMPHPERVFRSVQFSWKPETWGEHSPWAQLFDNARCWVD